MNWKDIQWNRLVWVATLVAAILGFVAGDFASFRSDDRKVLDREFSEVQQEAKRVLKDIRLFADQARGIGTVSEDELKQFKNNITNLHQSAKEISQRAPEVQPEFQAYVSAIIELQASADVMPGPLDSKAFVESVSSFVKAQDDFNKRVQQVLKAKLDILSDLLGTEKMSQPDD